MDVQIGPTSEPKPGYKTTEFWLSLLGAALGAIMASGAFDEDSKVIQLVGTGLFLLTTMGYTVGRIKVKNATTTNKVSDNTMSDDVVARLVDRVLQHKQTKANSRDGIDSAGDAGPTD